MITIDKTDDLTIFKVTGEVTADDILAKAVHYLEGEQSKASMWDFTQATKVEITTLELKDIADGVKRAAQDHMGRKVALVGSKRINIGLGKIFGAFAEMAGLPFTYKSFRDLEQAHKWLEE